MPNGKNHFIIGALTGLGVELFYARKAQTKPTVQELATSALIGGLAGVLPDSFEPATSPNHRQFFHSATTLGATFWGINQVNLNPSYDQKTKKFLNIILASYAGHLIVDSSTPKGIPLIGGG